MNRKKPKSNNLGSIISHTEMVNKVRKMQSKGDVTNLQFDPLGYLDVNGESQGECADFLIYRKRTVYASINGTYHCAGKLDEHPRTMAIVQNRTFIAERSDGTFDFSNRKVPLPEDYCLLIFYEKEDTLNLLVADGSVCKNVRVLSMEKSGDSKFVLLNAFFALLNERDARLAALARSWYGSLNLGNFYST